jgi:hypothetical protein
MSFKASEVTAETNCPNRYMGSSITLPDLTVLSCQERPDKSCWTSIVCATSNQNSADELLTSIAHVLDKERHGHWGRLTLSTQDLRRWGCQDAASPCSQLNPGQVLWPSYSRYLGRNAFCWADEMGLSNAQTPQTPQTPCRQCSA